MDRRWCAAPVRQERQTGFVLVVADALTIRISVYARKPIRAAALAEAKERAAERQAAEALIPKHLLYEKSSWPRVLPTPTEA